MHPHLAYDPKTDILYVYLDYNADFCHEVFVKLGHQGRFGEVCIDLDEHGRPLQFAITQAKEKYGDRLRGVDEVNPFM